MKRNLTLLALVSLFLVATNMSAQKKVLFIGNTNVAPVAKYLNCDANDTLAIMKLQSQGFVLTFVGDDETKATAAAGLYDAAVAKMMESDLVIVSSTVGSGDVSAITTATVNAGKPVLAWEYGVFDEMKMTPNTTVVNPPVGEATTNNAVDAKIIGSLTKFNYISTVRGVRTSKGFIQAAGVVNIATAAAKAMDGVTDTLIAVAQYLKVGELNTAGVAATASVISFPMLDNSNILITAEGWELFLRCACFLADKTYVPGFVKIATTNAANTSVWYNNGNLNLESAKNLTNSRIKIYNMEGKMVMNKVISGNGQVSVANLNNGVYMVVGEGFKTKFIKN